MYVLKGFIEIQPYIDNTPTIDSNLGELTNYSKTFSKELGFYTSEDNRDVRLVTFASKDIEVVDSEEISIDKQANLETTNTILNIAQWMFQRSASGALPKEPNKLIEAILHQFSLYIENLTIGNVLKLSGQQADVYLPEFIRFKLRNYNGDNDIHIWFADQSFRDQYPYYEIVVVPPFENIDDFFAATAVVKAHLDKMTPSKRQEVIHEAHDNYPSSVVKVEEFDYESPHDDVVFKTHWGVIIYGKAGDNPDAIKQAINEFILSNTKRPREDWIGVVPDVFRRTEFITIPLWENFSIPNETLIRGLYSPTLRLNKLEEIAVKGTHDYPLDHIRENVESTVFFYRSIPCLTCGGFENRDGIYTISELYKDYFVISNGDTEFSRMSPTTREWMNVMTRLIRFAEDATDFTGLPSGIAKVKRGGYLFLSTTFNDRQYLVMTQHSYLHILKPRLG